MPDEQAPSIAALQPPRVNNPTQKPPANWKTNNPRMLFTDATAPSPWATKAASAVRDRPLQNHRQSPKHEATIHRESIRHHPFRTPDHRQGPVVLSIASA